MKAKKIIVGLTCLTMTLGVAACSNEVPKETETPSPVSVFKAGTYTGKSNGMGGELTVDVTFTEDAIADVKVTKHGETYGLGYGVVNAPVDSFPSQIVENQSLAIDTVTGATITSNAVLNAVADAVKQAGGDPETMKKPIEKTVEDTTVDADIVIAGAGAAGLAAGIEALRAGVKDVVILEKQGVTGGATARSGGKIIASGTTWQEKQGIEDSPEQMYEYFLSMDGAEEQLDKEKVKEFCDNSVDNLTWLEDMGVMVHDVEAIHYSVPIWRVHNTTNKDGHAGGGMTSGYGGNFTVPMEEEFYKLGGKIIYNTAAQEILTDDNNVVAGLKGTRKDGSSVTVNASQVIIATGGYIGNKEMMSRYAESLGTEFYITPPSTNIGEGLTMAEKLGAKVFDAPTFQTCYSNYAVGVGGGENFGLMLNGRGERVANEYSYMYHVGNEIFKSNTDHGWYIATETDKHENVHKGFENEKVLKANSLEELAEKMGVDAEVFTAQVERYNELCAKGTDDDFGKPSEYMYPIEGDTYYAFYLSPAPTVSYGGLVTDIESRVINNDNQPIDGLYAAGEVSFTGLFGNEYPGCGMAIGSAVYYGRVAGINAAENVLNNK